VAQPHQRSAVLGLQAGQVADQLMPRQRLPGGLAIAGGAQHLLGLEGGSRVQDKIRFTTALTVNGLIFGEKPETINMEDDDPVADRNTH
jgi:hypothetical protein